MFAIRLPKKSHSGRIEWEKAEGAVCLFVYGGFWFGDCRRKLDVVTGWQKAIDDRPRFDLGTGLGQAREPSHYMCDQCRIHLVDIQSLWRGDRERVLSRVGDHVYQRAGDPSLLGPLVAELGRLNMTYPTLKILSIWWMMPCLRLMVCDAIRPRSNLSFEQFQLFITSAIACIKLLYAECEQAGYLCTPEPVVTGDGFSAGAVH